MYAVSERYMTEINNSFRKSSLYGTITTADGDTIELTNDNIVNQSVIIDKKIDTGGKLNLGGVYPAQLTIGLIGFNTTDVSGASISLTYRLWFNDTEYEDVPLGIYYVDNESIRRKKNVVTVDAFDALLKFDIETPENWGVPRLNYMVFASGDLAGVPYDTDEFNTLPNATTDINLSKAVYSQIQTLRDLLMWAGQLTGSFAYIDRTGTLRFKRIQGIRDDSGKVIPVREIQGDERFNTDFSDNTIRITRLTMKRGDGTVSKRQALTAGASDENRMTLELKENPLISTVSDEDVKTMFSNILKWSDDGLSTAIFRPFTTTFFGDPALDIGDYVRLRGGEIDTTRGYATGMITSYNWKYLNKHKIECAAQSSVLKDTATETPTAKNGISTFASTGDTENKQIQVKSQLEKRVEGLEATINNIQPPDVPSTNYLTSINFIEEYKAELTYVSGETKTYTGTLDDNGKLKTVSDGEKQCTVALDSALDTTRANDKAFAIACAVGVGVDTTIVTCEYYFESDGTYDLYYSASATWIDYGDGSAQGTSKSHYYTAGTYIVKFKNLYHAYGSPLFANQALRRVISGRLASGSSPEGSFRNCVNLIAINEDFFQSLTGAALNFRYAFIFCSSLQSIPEKLFSGISSQIKNLNSAFRECALTSIPAGLFDGVPNGTSFEACFASCGGITSTVPRLWETHPNSAHTECYWRCTNAANYADIPSGWK